MIIGLMSLKNQLVYIQFQPLAYTVKLNIEMSMAALITKLARGSQKKDATPDQMQFFSLSEQSDTHITSNTQTNFRNSSKNSASISNVVESLNSTEREKVKATNSKTDVDIIVEAYARSSAGNLNLQSDSQSSIFIQQAQPSEDAQRLDGDRGLELQVPQKSHLNMRLQNADVADLV
jgi:hypothetical protein